jgi:hypothetical protein
MNCLMGRHSSYAGNCMSLSFAFRVQPLP